MNEVKDLKTYRGCIQILRFTQDDKRGMLFYYYPKNK